MKEHTKESGREALEKLVAGFDRNLSHFKSSEYNETEARLSFIDPFWRCLGWPVGLQGSLPPSKVDVRVEISLEGAKPDYQFQPDGVVRFFCEAKRPHENIATDRKHIFQAKSYAWSFCQLERPAPFVVLTDFEEFRFFKAEGKPSFRHPERGRIAEFDLGFRDYLKCFDELWSTFSREAVAAGSLNRFLDYDAANRRSLDKEFLKDLLQWRALIASDFLASNPDLAKHELNEAVQRTLDRVIFIRMIEDRGAIPPGTFASIRSADDPFDSLEALSRRLEPQFNGLIFKAHFSEKLDLKGNSVSEIVRELEPAESPYRFTAIPVEFLGRVYESFLGHEIELSKDGKSCAIVEKPDLLKSGGIYYTPEYIVRQMVRGVLDPLTEGKSPRDLEALRILDLACGSGSFLIGVYDYLIEWHRAWYQANSSQVTRLRSRYKDDIQVNRDGSLSVSLKRKAEILKNNLFGVDIDSSAVEVATLSLYLKLLEGESGTARQLVLFAHGTILPDLTANIKCGNSILGLEPLSPLLLAELDEEEERRLNPFAWRLEFASILKEGGFHVIIGNPPYVKEYQNKRIFEDIRKTPLAKYCAGKMDIWYVFASVAIDLLRVGGMHSFITQNNWVASQSAKKLRAKFRAETRLLEFFDFHEYMVFENAGIQTMTYRVQKIIESAPYSAAYRRLRTKELRAGEVEAVLRNPKDERADALTVRIVPAEGEDVLAFTGPEVTAVLDRIREKGGFSILKSEVGQGIIGGPDDAFLFESTSDFTVAERPYLHDHYTTAGRFEPGAATKKLAYIARGNLDELDESELPNFKRQIEQFKAQLSERRETKSGTIEYFHLHWPRDERLFKAGPKLACPTRVSEPSFYYVEDEYYASRAVNMLVSERINLKVLCGILNSSVVHFWLIMRGKRLGAMLQIDTGFLLDVPIPAVRNRGPETEALINSVVSAVESETQKRNELRSARSSSDRDRLQRRISGLSRDLDKAVYALYGLSEADIQVIENELARVRASNAAE